MENILNINAVIFTVMGYPMSYIEFIGTIFNLWCVWLTVKGKISSWPVGIVGIVFYIFLFYQIRLYSDLFEQFYFLVMSFYGWWLWLNISGRKKDKDAGELKISVNSKPEQLDLWRGHNFRNGRPDLFREKHQQLFSRIFPGTGVVSLPGRLHHGHEFLRPRC